MQHINRLIDELQRRFPPSPIQGHLSILFDPQYLIEHKKEITSNTYGRSSLDFLRKRHQYFEGFDFTSVLNKWLSVKVSLIDYIKTVSHDYSPMEFWKNFLLLKQSVNSSYRHQHKKILLLMHIYLISPTNATECERGVCWL